MLLSGEKGKREGGKIVPECTGTWPSVVSDKAWRLDYELTPVPKRPYPCDIYAAQVHVLNTQLQEPFLIPKCCWCKVSNPPNSGMTIRHCSYFHLSLADTPCPLADPAWQNSLLSHRAHRRSTLHLVIILVSN